MPKNEKIYIDILETRRVRKVVKLPVKDASEIITRMHGQQGIYAGWSQHDMLAHIDSLRGKTVETSLDREIDEIDEIDFK